MAEHPAAGRWRRRLARSFIWLCLAVLLVAATIIVGAAVDARRRLPELQPWHRLIPRAEVRARDIDPRFTLADYLRREDEVFAEVRSRVEDTLPPGEANTANRYARGSRSSPTRFDRDYNRTFEVEPRVVRGGALLVHGLTDAPYSMRAIARQLEADGYYSLVLRVPGHGTVPAGLVEATADDWNAAVRLGARHVRQHVGPNVPLLVVGYSNGGALAVRYTLDALDDPSLPRPAGVVLVSPMIGVSPFARLARIISALGVFPYFEKARWLDIIPEYNPFKYNSFPANAGRQSFEVTRGLQRRLAEVAASGRLAGFPPVLTFQSIVDATVSTAAVVSDLYDQLPAKHNELVLFDINRHARLDPFIQPSDLALVARLFERRPRAYGITLVTNARSDTLDVVARRIEPGAMKPVDEPMGLAWPRDIFSLSHVALPFPEDDPVYGAEAQDSPTAPVALGLLSPRGERSVLTVPVEVLMRVSANPFFPYLAKRLSAWAAAEGQGSSAQGGSLRPNAGTR
jgi:alpha-beta hydrolase superfamily lysophospholipase